MREISEETGNDESRYYPGDLSTARKLLGHSGPATTAGYDRRAQMASGVGPNAENAKAAAAEPSARLRTGRPGPPASNAPRENPGG